MEKILQKIKHLPKDKKISILPHDNTDVDSVYGSILLSKLLEHFKIKNEILIFDDNINEENKYFCEKVNFDFEKHKTKYENEDRLLFLVDHYETVHKGKVIGCIDHHFVTKKIYYDIYLYKNSSSASFIIYELMKKEHMQITKEIVLLTAYATIADTCSFVNTKTNLCEKEEILSLLKKYNFDIDKMLKESLVMHDLSKMSIKEIVYNGVKNYNFNSNCVKSSYIQIDNLEISNEIIDEISKIVKKEKIDMWIFIVFDMIGKKTKIFYITQDCMKVETFNLILSRGQYIIPKVEKFYYN